MSLRETLEQLPDDYEVTIRAKAGSGEYTDLAGVLLDQDHYKGIRLADFELASEVYLPGQNGYPLPGDVRAYEHGDIGGHIEPPDDIVIQGPIGEWLKVVEPETEATLASLGAGLIAGLGAYLGRGVKLKVGRISHYANTFVVQVGPTSSARKGTADGEVINFLHELDSSFAIDNVASGFGSGEALIERVADPQENSKGEIIVGTQDQRLYIQEAEFSKVLRIADRQGNILSDVIRLAFDGNRPLANAAKTSRKLISSRHCISLFGGITPDELIQIFPALAAVSGTGNRYLWVWSDSKKLLPFGGRDVDISSITFQARRNMNEARKRRVLEYSPDALAWWEDYYPQLRQPDWIPPNIQPMVSRISDQVQRIALVYAATQGASHVTVDHLAAGYAWVEHSITTVRAVLGGLVRNPEASKVLASLRQHPGVPANKRELYEVFGRHITSTALDAAISELQEAQLAFSWEGPGKEKGGRPPTLVMATTPTVVDRRFGFVRSQSPKKDSGSLFAKNDPKQENLQSVTGKIDIEQTPNKDTLETNLYDDANELTPEEYDDYPDPW